MPIPPCPRPGAFWPTEPQWLLLRAALASGDEALAAWDAVRPWLERHRLDAGSRSLLPLVQANAHRHGIVDPILDRLKVVRREATARNAALLAHAGPLLAALHGAGVETLVLKGGALAVAHYRGLGLRPMTDVDILVRPEAVQPATDVLRHAGWVPWYPLTPAFVETRHAGMFDEAGHWPCDLHWRVFEEHCPPGADMEFWAAAVPLEIAGVATRALGAADQLLHVMVHGAKWKRTPGIRWVADAMMVLRAGPVDWARVRLQAERRWFGLVVRETLGYLREAMGAPVPDAVLAAFRALPVSPLERFEWRIRAREHRWLGLLPFYWCNYRRYCRVRGAQWGPHLVGFSRYLEAVWEVDSLGAMAAGAARRATIRVGAALGGRSVPRRPA